MKPEWFIPYVALAVVIYYQWLPEWVAIVLAAAPTVAFVGCVIFALIDPYMFVSNRGTKTGENAAQGFAGRKRP